MDLERWDAWHSYYWEPGGSVFRNLFDVHDAAALARLEHAATFHRSREIESGAVAIPRTYDAEHLKAIHRHLFQDVYPWAGELRLVDIRKGKSDFAYIEEILVYLEDARRYITTTEWSALDRESFTEAAACVFSYVNQAHPFREGNGRAAKIFVKHATELGPWRLKFDPAVSGITPAIWNRASMLSAPERGTYSPVPDPLVPVFRALTQPAADSPGALSSEAAEAQRIAGASSPRSVRASAGTPPAPSGERGRLAGSPARRDYGSEK